MKIHRKHGIHKRLTAGVLAASLFLTLPGMEKLKVSAGQAEAQGTELSEMAGKVYSLYAGVDLKEAEGTEFGTKNLIVCTEQEDFDALGAEEKIYLGDGIYVLSYPDSESAKAAWESYQEMEGIDFAEADAVVKAQTEEKQDGTEEDSQAETEELEEAENGKEDSTTKEKAEAETSGEKAEVKEETQDAEKEPDSGNDAEDETEDASVEETESEAIEDVPEETAEDDIVRVALLDTGIKADIGNLASYIQETGINASGSGEAGNTGDDNSHGTSMAQVIVSAAEENGKDADSMRILPVKVLDGSGYGTTLTAYLGMKAAMEQGADIICLGLSGKAESKLLGSAVEEAYDAGITVTGAAGNDASDVAEYVPGRFEKAVIVSNVKNQEEAAADTNYGDTVDFSAYGTREVLNFSGEAATVTGTSIACAYVTGVTASFGKGMSCEETEVKLTEKAVPVAQKEGKNYFGKGIIGAVPETEEQENTYKTDKEGMNKELPSQNQMFGSGNMGDESGWISTDIDEENGYWTTTKKSKTGYHLDAEITHMHTEDDAGYVMCDGSGLNPSKDYLKSRFKSKKIKVTEMKIVPMQRGGIDDTVSHYALQVTCEGIGTFNVAEPYICPDGYAAYSYVKYCYSYCDKTERWYHVESNHRWLGCTRGDVGENENYKWEYQHKIYHYSPNKYKIVFDENGATSGSMNDQSMTYDTAKKLNENKYKRTGYTFTGWNTKQNGSGDSYDNKQKVKNLTDKKDGTVTLYAQWVKNTATIQYHANGGGAKPDYTLSSNLVYKDGSKVTKSVNYTTETLNLHNVGTLFTRKGYHVDADTAWRINSTSGSTISQNDGTSAAPLTNLIKNGNTTITLYANWIINKSTLKVNPNGGSWNGYTSTRSYTQNYNTILSIPVPAITNYKVEFDGNGGKADILSKKTNKAFSGWTKSSPFYGTLPFTTSATTYTFGANDNVTSTITANWSGSYNITLPGASKEGYDLLGWSTNRNATKADTGYTAGSTVTVSSNKTLYAVWKEKTYTIKYDANGGTGTMENGTKKYFTPYTIKDNAFIRDGYDFEGWSTKKEGPADEKYAPGKSYDEKSDITLYAIWEEHFNVAYIGNGQTLGTDFIDAGENGSGYSEKLDYTFDDNKEDEAEDYFQKTDTVTYTNEETGETIEQEIEGTVVGWKMASEDIENVYKKYELGEKVPGEDLVNDSKNRNNLTIGSPGIGYNEFKENSIVATAMSSVRGATAASATIPSLGGVGTVYGSTPYVNMYAVWDMGPVIETYDRYYTLEEAQSGFITEEELLNAAKATDEEVKSGSNEEGRLKNFVDEENRTSFTVMDYQVEEFADLTGPAVISVTYRAEDAAGNVTKKMIKIHIVDGNDTVIDGHDIGTDPDDGKVRFISKEYLDTLDDNSVWVKNDDYKKELAEVVSYERSNPEQSAPVPLLGNDYTVDIPGTGEWNKTPQSVWTFTREQVKEAQKFVEDYGPSNYVHEDGLEKFYEKFSSSRTTH